MFPPPGSYWDTYAPPAPCLVPLPMTHRGLSTVGLFSLIAPLQTHIGMLFKLLLNSRGLRPGALCEKIRCGSLKVVFIYFQQGKQIWKLRPELCLWEERFCLCLDTLFSQPTCAFFLCSCPPLPGWALVRLLLFRAGLQNTVLHLLTFSKKTVS